MSLIMKRKRGRPRQDESRKINDFDVNLIKEFERYPAFYNRNDEQYKNREYVEQLWHNVASQLGYNVNAVKSRMNQLRTRYSQEKRRVDHLQMQYQDPSLTSQWPLFKSLDFMSDHIKSRRHYPKGRTDDTQRSNSSEAEEEEVPERKPFIEEELPVTNGEAPHNSRPSVSSQDCKEPLDMPDVTEPIISVNFPTQKPSGKSAAKYYAFGNFMATSLIDLPETSALALVNKFTSQLIASLAEDKYHAS